MVWAAAADAHPLPPTDGTLLGIRTALGKYGVSLGLQSISDLFGHPDGGRANDSLSVISTSVSLAAIPHGGWSPYTVVDARLAPAPRGKDGKAGLSAFARASTAPPGRNAISSELAAGLVYQGRFRRDGDQAGFAVASVRVGQPLGQSGAASRFT